MNSLKVFLLITLLMLLVACTNDQKSEPKQVTVNDALIELNSIAIEFNGSAPDQNSTDLKLVKGLGDAKIVGLGEATHGSKEFFEMKHRIFKYLVEEKGFRIMGFECDLAESLYLDHYITTGEIVTGDPDLRTMMRNKIHFWTWRVEEVARLIEWMRDFNVNREASDMVHLYGVDCQSLKDASFFFNRFFGSNKPEIWEEFKDFFEELDKTDYSTLAALNGDSKENFKNNLLALKNRIIEFREQLMGTGEREYLIHQRIAETLLQNFNLIADNIGNRDHYMGENALWLSELNSGGVALWAHNSHSCYKLKASGKSMGKYMKDLVGNDYHAVAFGFAKGSFVAKEEFANKTYGNVVVQEITREPMKDSINELFYKADSEKIILRLNDVEQAGTLKSWLNTGRYHQSIGALYGNEMWEKYYTINNINLLEYCDYFFWFRNVKAAKRL